MSIFLVISPTCRQYSRLEYKKRTILGKRLAGFSLICFNKDRFLEMNNQNHVPTSSMSESPSLANLQNKQNRDQQYLAVRCNPNSNRNSNSADSGSYKAEGNEYIEDICPYATFQLNKQTYSESSYSGNVYSGPYHSVRGSFVYHDVKTDGYHV